jgi:peptidoglycan/xylan/chitin deacetylase (PgdA/CDA1 family)
MKSPQKLEYVASSLPVRVLRKIRRVAAQLFYKTPLVIPPDFRGVSFCFDDFPQTALRGAEILESCGARGIFYTCFSLLGKESVSGKIAELPDVLALAQRGHEIGCHTYDHIDCSMTPALAVRDSCQTNRKMAAHNGLALKHFSYPEGEMSLGAKRVLRKNYQTARSVLKGINQGGSDAHCLKAVPLYGLSLGSVQDIIHDVDQTGGWLILYTHDVSDTPSAYGTTPETLHLAVKLCSDLNIPVLTIGEGLHRLKTQC